MYLNYRRIINTKSKVIHAVPKNKSYALCGHPQWGNVQYMVDHHHWEDTDKKPTCLTCKKIMKKRGK